MNCSKEKYDLVAKIICGKEEGLDDSQCYAKNSNGNFGCSSYHKCRIAEKSDEQLSFVLHQISQNSFLRACAGSGKTEVVGLKAAYELKKWSHIGSGIAILTFTNNAADVIKERVIQFAGVSKSGYPHFVGTFDSWLHGYIANPFLYLETNYKSAKHDNSIRVVDDRSDAVFLHSFKTKYQYWNTGYVKANEFSFDVNGETIFSSGDQFADKERNQQSGSLETWQYKDFLNTKKGFGTQDLQLTRILNILVIWF